MGGKKKKKKKKIALDAVAADAAALAGSAETPQMGENPPTEPPEEPPSTGASVSGTGEVGDEADGKWSRLCALTVCSSIYSLWLIPISS